MNHASEGALQAYLDDELNPADKRSVADHLAACSTCAAEMGLLRRASERFSAVVTATDVPTPPLEPEVLTRYRWMQRTIVARRMLARAAVLLVFVSAAAAAALPGSPLRRLAVDLWHEARGLFGSAPEAVEAPPVTPATPAPVAAVSVQPLEGGLRFVVVGAAPGTRLHVQLVAGTLGAVQASGAATDAHFRTAPGRIEVRDAPPGDLTVRIPRSALSASVVVDGRTLLVKQGSALRLLATPVDSSATGIVFRIGS